MSNSEMERLARIRMQVTGETLASALAALQVHSAPADDDAQPLEAPRTGGHRTHDTQPDAPRPHGARSAADALPRPPVLRICPDPAAGS
ncbi:MULTISPECIES: hypothetical protein [unclassified Streptomyces]|uniref:hypothetical protein n=1 Tax=unclassified Streptomyces TaxID=2593676 RepID=UPI003815FA45